MNHTEPIKEGDRFGRLVARKDAGTDRRGNRSWRCVCDCGGEKTARADHLRIGATRSCGCLQREERSRPLRTYKWVVDGKAAQHHPLYRIWQGMHQRCENPRNSDFRHYGGRGIVVCERWHKSNPEGFANFIADMGPRPDERHSIDRFPDPDGPYDPYNTAWATPDEQGSNRTRHGKHRGELRPNAKLTAVEVREIRGSSERQKDLAERFGVSQATVSGVQRRQKWRHV